MYNIAVTCLVLTALFSYLNIKFIKLPTTIGVMVISLLLSGGMIALNLLGFSTLHTLEVNLLSKIDFSTVLMQGMLSLLLFAGALHVDLSELVTHRKQIGLLAVVGTLLSTVIVGFALWWVLPFVGIPLPLVYCLLFGALISPTDPIAVMGILKSAGAPKSLAVVIAGESLFNDGVGVVLFALVLGVATAGTTPTVGAAGLLLLHEAGGGILFGLVLGYVLYLMIKSIDSYEEEVLLTLAAVMGGYALADAMHISGPLAMVVTGLVIGNHGRALAMSDKTRQHVDMFWELLDSMLNALLFVLLGLEIVMVPFTGNILTASVVVILVTLGARLLAAGVPVVVLPKVFALPKGSWQVLTWGGLRGGISVALALSVPAGPYRNTVLALTYAVVVFSILCQGLTMTKVTKAAVQPS